MGVKSIKLESGISDPDFVEISINARKHERAHLLGLLRIYVGQLKKESATPETREIYSAFNLHALSVRRSVSAKSRDMAGEVIGVLRGDVGRNSGACGAWTSTIENLRPAAIWIGFDLAAGFDNGEPSDEHA